MSIQWYGQGYSCLVCCDLDIYILKANRETLARQVKHYRVRGPLHHGHGHVCFLLYVPTVPEAPHFMGGVYLPLDVTLNILMSHRIQIGLDFISSEKEKY